MSITSFASSDDSAPLSLTRVLAEMPSFNILPVYGVNCISLIKHDTLVITVDAVLLLEERILSHLHRARPLQSKFKYMDHKERVLAEAGDEFDADADEQPPFV